MKTTKAILILAGALILLFSPVSSMADTMTFYRITDNGNGVNLTSQLSVEVAAVGTTQVSFTFYNNVGIESSITDVYFDDGTLLGIAAIASSAGVIFAQPATPANLPSGNTATPPFVTTDSFSADSDTPIMENGVNTSTEYLIITFNLLSDKTFADTRDAIAKGDLRVGLHVQDIGTVGGSDSYVSKVPEPGILILLGIAMSAIGAASWRIRKI